MGFQVSDSVVARVGFNQFNKNFSTSSGSVNYDGKLKLSSLDALLDWHLFGGATHLTVGIMSNDNKFNLTGTPAGKWIYTFNGQTYTCCGSWHAESVKLTFNSAAPYLGFGWNSQPKNKGLSFKSDIGVMFQGSPKVTDTIQRNSGGNATVARRLAVRWPSNRQI